LYLYLYIYSVVSLMPVVSLLIFCYVIGIAVIMNIKYYTIVVYKYII